MLLSSINISSLLLPSNEGTHNSALVGSFVGKHTGHDKLQIETDQTLKAPTWLKQEHS